MTIHTVERRALMEWDEFYPHTKGRYLVEIWRDVAGKIDRSDGPAVIITQSEDSQASKYGYTSATWYSNGVAHRKGKPAHIARHGDTATYEWHYHGKLHNDYAPAVIVEEAAEPDDVPVRVSETWSDRGREHRYGGPSHVRIGTTGDILTERWMQNGLLHRTDGPALISRDLGVIEEQQFFVRGIEVAAVPFSTPSP